MGLMVHSLGELPLEAKRAYYVYLLDYGWHEPLAEAVYKNFDKMSDLASRRKAVVIRGIVGSHFADEVLSWHHVNGQPSEEIHPAILITTIHPQHFKMMDGEFTPSSDELLLIPLKKTCKNSLEVVSLIEKLFKDIADKKGIQDFEVAKELKKGKEGALVDALILQPNFGGLGVDVKRIIGLFKRRR